MADFPNTNPIKAAAVAQPELLAVIDGLAYAARPLFEAAREITERYSLGPRGAFMLNLISDGVCYPDQLSARLKTLPSLITSDLARLKEAGLVSAAPCADDRRRSRLNLTEAGERACASLRGKIVQFVSDNLAPYSPEQLRLFGEMLAAVRHIPEG